MKRVVLLLAVALLFGGCRSTRQIITEQTHETDSTAVEQRTEAATTATTDSTKAESTATTALEITFAPPTDTTAQPAVNEVELPDGTHIRGNIASVRMAATQTAKAEASSTQEGTTAANDYSSTTTASQDTDRKEKSKTPPAVRKVVIWPAFVIAGGIVASMGYLQYRLKRRKRMK